MFISKFFKFVSSLSVSFLFLACTTDSGDDDGMKGSLVIEKSVGDETNGLSCKVSRSGLSAFLKLTQFVNGSFVNVDYEYRFLSDGEGTHSLWEYVDLEFKDFPKSEAMSICKGFQSDMDDDEGLVECNLNDGHVERHLAKHSRVDFEDFVDGLVGQCEDFLEGFNQKVDNDDDDADDDDKGDDDKGDSRDEGVKTSQSGMAVLEKGEKLSQRVCGASNVGEMLFVMDSSEVFFCDGEGWRKFNEEKGASKGDKGNTSEPIAPSGGNDFSCTVSQENGKVYLRVYMNEMSLIMNAEMVYEQTGTEWLISSRTAYDGPGAVFTAKDECSEYRSDYSSAIASGEMTLVCGEKSVEWSMSEQDVGTSVSQLMFTLQTECDELKQGYNGYDLDGPREKPSDIPTSCKITEGESTLTMNISYSDWSYSSTIEINGSTSHEEEEFVGNYGDLAAKTCASDKNEPDHLSVNCDGGKISIDGVWDESLTLAEMKVLSDYMCDALLDGSLSFEELMFGE